MSETREDVRVPSHVFKMTRPRNRVLFFLLESYIDSIKNSYHEKSLQVNRVLNEEEKKFL